MISPFLHEASQATPFSFIDKIINHEAAVKQASSSWLPGGTALLYPAMAVELHPAMAVELLMPPMIVVGFYDGMAAFVLAGYCAVSALLFHNFWASPRFWSSDSEGYPHVWDFFKDFGLVGGLMFVMLASGIFQTAEKEIEKSTTLGQTAPLYAGLDRE
ncbi:MAG: DoxX family protein [Methyloceanibacter sp.]